MALEAIGLGLGIAPFLIELLKANPEPVHAMMAIKTDTAKEMMEEFYRDLEYEVSMFKITLINLIHELPITDDLKQELTDEKGIDSTLWKDPSPELKVALERRLSACFEAFLQSMGKILKLLSKVVKDGTLPVDLPEDHIVSIHKSRSSFIQC
jgi:hypothetical protein